MRGRKTKEAKDDGLAPAFAFTVIFIVLNVVLTGPLIILYLYGYMGYNPLTFTSDAALSLSFPLSVMCYFIFYRKRSWKDIVSSVGLGKKGLGINLVVLLGVLVFFILFVLEITVGVISQVTNVPINTNVSTILAAAPLWFYVFTGFIAPIDEEFLFRGFLVNRPVISLAVLAIFFFGIIAAAATGQIAEWYVPVFGIALVILALIQAKYPSSWNGLIISSVAFSAGHTTYNSTFGIEVIAALVFALLAGYVYKKTNSLYPSIVAHILLNTLTLVLTFAVLL